MSRVHACPIFAGYRGTPFCSPAGADPAAERAAEILQGSGVTGGLIVHLGCGDGRLTAALSAGGNFVVQGLDADGRHFALGGWDRALVSRRTELSY